MITKSFYFPHDRNVRNNAKVMNLIKHEGMAGYGAYWVIMEYLHAQDGYTALLDSVSYIARLCSSNIRKLKRIVMEYDLFVIEGDTFHSEELIQKMQPFERKFGQTLNQDSDKKETAKSDKSLKTNEKTFSSEAVYNNININKKKNKNIKEKISSSSVEEIQKKDASPKPQVSEEEDIFVKPVISESCSSVPTPAPATKPAEQPSAPTATPSAKAADSHAASPAPMHPAKGAPSAAPPNTSQQVDSAPAPGWETWIDMLEHDESWKKLMDRRSRLRGYFLALYGRVVAIFKDHIRGMGKEHTIRSLNDAKRYFFCFVDPESYTGKRFYVRMQDEIKYWRQDYIHEEYNPYTGKRSYWGGTPIPADAPPRPHDRAKWNDETASWQ